MKKLLEIFAKVAILCTVILSLSLSLATLPVSAETYKQGIQSDQNPKLKKKSEVTTSSKNQTDIKNKTSELVVPETTKTQILEIPEAKITITPQIMLRRDGGNCTLGITYPHYHSPSGEIIRIEDK